MYSLGFNNLVLILDAFFYICKRDSIDCHPGKIKTMSATGIRGDVSKYEMESKT